MKEIIDFLCAHNIEYKENEPMSLHTSFHIGGNAEVFALVKTVDELSALVRFCFERNINPLTVGNGSNLLVSDTGIDGLVIRLCGDFDNIKLLDETTIEAGAGTSLAALCKFAHSVGLTGLEFAYGIPGSVGGAVFMNAGAYGGQMSDVVKETRHICGSGELSGFSADELEFDYRKSVYSTGSQIITSVVLQLKKGEKQEISSKMNELIQRRKDKQPLEFPSAGSVFKRPEGYFAGALIEQCGLKGKTIGGASISEKHAGFIVNVGGATCRDVTDLIKHCQDIVFEKFGVKLEPEIKMI